MYGQTDDFRTRICFKDFSCSLEPVHWRHINIDENFTEVYDIKKDKIILIEGLYHADVPAFEKAITEIPDSLDVVAIFSHNPGITEYANHLTNKIRLDNMPTSSVFAVKADVKSWKDFSAAQKEFWFFDYPKSLND